MGRKSTAKVQITLLALALLLSISAAYLVYASPTQTGTSWKDSFTDQSGIAALSNINFSTGNLSLNNSPWFYPNHDYRKQITVNGSTSNLSDYQVPINITTAIYNNTGLVGSYSQKPQESEEVAVFSNMSNRLEAKIRGDLTWHFTSNDTSDSSGYGNNGAQNGGVNCTVTGKFGTGCGFDGKNIIEM